VCAMRQCMTYSSTAPASERITARRKHGIYYKTSNALITYNWTSRVLQATPLPTPSSIEESSFRFSSSSIYVLYA
jgi:hypothetical protein